MKLYHISQSVNTDYDTFDSAVVAAEDPTAARYTHPRKGTKGNWWDNKDGFGPLNTWAPPEQVKVFFIGLAKNGTKAGVVCASFNAG